MHDLYGLQNLYDLYDTAHLAASEPYSLHDLLYVGYFSRVGFVCTRLSTDPLNNIENAKYVSVSFLLFGIPAEDLVAFFVSGGRREKTKPSASRVLRRRLSLCLFHTRHLVTGDW